jgi:hypothetical protein
MRKLMDKVTDAATRVQVAVTNEVWRCGRRKDGITLVETLGAIVIVLGIIAAISAIAPDQAKAIFTAGVTKIKTVLGLGS